METLKAWKALAAIFNRQLALSKMIETCIAEKRGNKEFTLSFMDYREGAEGRQRNWQAAIGNRTDCVCIGEAAAYGEVDLEHEASTAGYAVAGLLAKVREANAKAGTPA